MGSLKSHFDYFTHFSNMNSLEKKEEQIAFQAVGPSLDILTIEKVPSWFPVTSHSDWLHPQVF